MGILIERHFFSLSAALPYDPFRSKEITDISIIIISYASTFTQHLDSQSSNPIKFVLLYFISLKRCYHNDIAAVDTFSFFREGEIDGSWDGFSETSVKRIHGLFELVYMPVSARGFALLTQQVIGKLELH